MSGYDRKVVMQTHDAEYIFRGFEKILLYKAWSYLSANGYPVEK